MVLWPFAAGVLEILARRHGSLVSHESLRAVLYADVLEQDRPTSDTMPVHVSEIRMALRNAGGVSGNPIESIPGEGYKLTIPIKIIAPTQVRCDKCGSLYMAPGSDDAEQRA